MTLQRRSIALFDSLVRSTASGESVAAWCRRTTCPLAQAEEQPGEQPARLGQEHRAEHRRVLAEEQ